jgi:hypothetical protein
MCENILIKMSKKPLWFSLVLVISILFVSCSSSGDNPSSAQDSNVELELTFEVSSFGKLNSVEGLKLDSIEVRVNSTDMNSVSWVGELSMESIKIPSFPAGDSIMIEAYLYDSLGVLMFQGDTLLNLAGGEQLLELNVNQEFGVIRAEMALGWYSAVGEGLLKLFVGNDTLLSELEMKNGLGMFELSKIPFGSSYPLTLEICDTLGTSMFEVDTIVDVLRGQSDNMVFKMSPLLSEMALKLNINKELQLEIRLENSNASKVSPALGRLIITELMPNPKSSGDSLEWVELANLGGDTLDLNECSLRKTYNSSTASTRLDLQGLSMAPSEVLVLGREAMNVADWNYSEFTMTNSTGSLLLVCEGVVFDSLAWGEGEVLNGELQSLQSQSLSLDDTSIPNEFASWCHSARDFKIGGNQFKGSPGEFETCLVL